LPNPTYERLPGVGQLSVIITCKCATQGKPWVRPKRIWHADCVHPRLRASGEVLAQRRSRRRRSRP